VVEAKKSELSEKQEAGSEFYLLVRGGIHGNSARRWNSIANHFLKGRWEATMQGWTLSADEIDEATVCDLESSMPDGQMECWQGSLHAARSGKARRLRRQPI
jgi:hypothetical protein